MNQFKAWLHRITAPPQEEASSLPFCVSCKKGLKRHQKHTVVSILHQDCEAGHE